MRVLLGLGGVELLEAGLGDDLGHRHDLRGREGRLHAGNPHLVFGEGHEREVSDDALAREAVEVLLHQRPGELPRAVGPEVEEDDRVAVLHRRAVADDVRRHQLVAARVVLVAALDGGDRAIAPRSGRVDDRVVRELGALPALVAVHRVVAAMHGRDRRGDLSQELERAARRHVAAIEERVHDDASHAFATQRAR